MAQYDLASVRLPRLTGRGLRAFAAALENPVIKGALLRRLLRDGGMAKLRDMQIDEPPTFYPLVLAEAPTAVASPSFTLEELASAGPLPQATSYDYATAYRAGQITPETVAARILDAIQTSNSSSAPLRAFIANDRHDIITQAHASAQRLAAQQGLSLLDGVPVAVKDEIDQVPYPTTVGTRILGSQPAQTDSTVVARLRAAGALLIGKTNMHEIGINPDSANIHHGTVRNPYNPAHDAGGSSSGSAAAVAAGFCPVAMGADGGGSIRVPAAHCGVVGLKATFGRVSGFGAFPLDWSLGHLGPIGASVADVALVYSVIAGPDPSDPLTHHQPPVTVQGWNKGDLLGLTLGIDEAWFNHAAPEVVATCRALLDRLQTAGAKVRTISVPQLDAMRIAHATTILSEMATSMQNVRADLRQMAPATRINLAVGRAATSRDYVQAQRVRTRAIQAFRELFAEVDLLVTPATAVVAPPFPVNGLSDGWSDLSTVTEVMRYMFVGNLVGLPAISFPAGYTAEKLPVGMQVMGSWWAEHLLLRVAYVAEQCVARQRPLLHYPILPEPKK